MYYCFACKGFIDVFGLGHEEDCDFMLATRATRSLNDENAVLTEKLDKQDLALQATKQMNTILKEAMAMAIDALEAQEGPDVDTAIHILERFAYD